MRVLEKEKQPERSWFIDAIEKHISSLYFEVAEASEKYRHKCKEILTYIDVYQHPGDQEQDVPAHWHYITYGVSGLKQNQIYLESNDFICGEEAKSSYFELTFRLKCSDDVEVPPQWPLFMLQSFARYVQFTGNDLSIGDHIPWNTSLDRANPDDLDSRLCHDSESSSIKHLLVAEDPELMTLVMDQCNIHFRQLLGILEPEMKAAQHWKGCGLLDLCSLTPQAGGPYFVTDMSRKLSVFDYQPYFIKMVGTKISSEGSNLAQVTALCYWEGVSSGSLTSSVKMGSGGTLLEEFTLESATIYIDEEASELLSVAARGRLAHSKHFMYESPHGEMILFIPPGCIDNMVSVNSTTPLKALGTSLQIYCGNDFISQLAEAANTFNLRYQHTMTKEIHLNYPRVKIVISKLTDGPTRSKLSFSGVPSDVKDADRVISQNSYLECSGSARNCQTINTDKSAYSKPSFVGSDSDVAVCEITAHVQEEKDMLVNKIHTRHGERMAARYNFDENEVLLRSVTQLEKHHDSEIVQCSCQGLQYKPSVQAPPAVPHRKSSMIKSVISTATADKTNFSSTGTTSEIHKTLLPQSGMDPNRLGNREIKPAGDKPVADNKNIKHTPTEVLCTEEQCNDSLAHLCETSSAVDSKLSTVNGGKQSKHCATSVLHCESKCYDIPVNLGQKSVNCAVTNNSNLSVMTSLSNSDTAQRKQNGKHRSRKTDRQPVKTHDQSSALVQPSMDFPLQESGNAYSLPRSASKQKDRFSILRNWHSLPRSFSKSKGILLFEEQPLSISEKLIAGFSDLNGVSVPVLNSLHTPYLMRKKSALQKSLSLKCLRAASPVSNCPPVQPTITHSFASSAVKTSEVARADHRSKSSSGYLNETPLPLNDMEWDPQLTVGKSESIQSSSQLPSTALESSVSHHPDKSSRQKTRSGKDKYYKKHSVIPNMRDMEVVVVETTQNPCSQRNSNLSFVMEENEDPNTPLLHKMSSKKSTLAEYITNGRSCLPNHNESDSFEHQLADKASSSYETQKETGHLDYKLAFDITLQSVSFTEPLENTNFDKGSSCSEKQEDTIIQSFEGNPSDVVHCSSVGCKISADSVCENLNTNEHKDNIIIPKPVMRRRRSRSRFSSHHAAAVSLVPVMSENA